MKKFKFYVNDGLDGIVLAKSENQAIGIISKFYDVPKLVLKKSTKGKMKKSFEEWIFDKWSMKNIKGKSRIIGFCE